MREDLEVWFHVLSREGNSNGRKFVGMGTPPLETEMPNSVLALMPLLPVSLLCLTGLIST